MPDLNGALHVIDRGRPQVYLDIARTFAPDFFSGRGLGQGFGFVAFHPEFKDNGRFYTVHTETGNAVTAKTPDLPSQPNTLYHGVVTEWTANDPSASTFQGEHREVLRIGFAGQIHGIQQVDFNPTARVGTGTMGCCTSPSATAVRAPRMTILRTSRLPHGKILRIDPEARNSANGKYGYPRDNPFAGEPGALGEIYAFGMRDPHRFSWDRWRASPDVRWRTLASTPSRRFTRFARATISVGASVKGNFSSDVKTAATCIRCRRTTPDSDYTYPWPPTITTRRRVYRVTRTAVTRFPAALCTVAARCLELEGKYVFGDIVDGRLLYSNERDAPGSQGSSHLSVLTLRPYGQTLTMPELVGDKRVDLRFGRDASASCTCFKGQRKDLEGHWRASIP